MNTVKSTDAKVVHVSTYLTFDEQEALDKAAERAGLTRSSYVRKLVLFALAYDSILFVAR